MSVTIHAFEAGVGAEVRGVDVAEPLPSSTVGMIRDAWLDHCVLLLRDQQLTDKALMEFSRQFGVLELPPSQLLNYSKGSGQRPEIPPEINVISNVKENGKPIGQLGAGEAAWHTDSAYFDVPPMASILYAIEIPPAGGNTSFLNMYAAFETLPDELRDTLDGRQLKHDPTYTSAGTKRDDYEEVRDVRQSPGPLHPIVRTHPETGRKALYLGRRLSAYIDGLSVPDSEALLDELWRHVVQPQFSWEHVWRKGDVVMWDNRCVMHRREAFDDASRRLLHRTQLQGDRPI